MQYSISNSDNKQLNNIQPPSPNANGISDWTTVIKKKEHIFKTKRNYKYKNSDNTFNKSNTNTEWIKIDETWNDYLNTIKKIDNKICRNGEKNCDWVYRIFDGKQELDCVECVTNEFLIIPSEKNKLAELVKTIPYNFDILVFPFDSKLRTIRNLKSNHIPLLKRMKEKAIEVISKYIKSLDESKLHCEFHYLPSTYHLHLHIGLGKETTTNQIKNNVYKFDEVISNLESDSDYYTKSIPIYVRNESNWNSELEKYSKYNNVDNSSKCDSKWKFFENMDCYKKYNSEL